MPDARVDSGTGGIYSLGNPEQRHQLVITGDAIFSGSFSGLSGTYNVWNLGFRQLLVHSSVTTPD